jgi:hypothetical protein
MKVMIIYDVSTWVINVYHNCLPKALSLRPPWPPLRPRSIHPKVLVRRVSTHDIDHVSTRRSYCSCACSRHRCVRAGTFRRPYLLYAAPLSIYFMAIYYINLFLFLSLFCFQLDSRHHWDPIAPTFRKIGGREHELCVFYCSKGHGASLLNM